MRLKWVLAAGLSASALVVVVLLLTLGNDPGREDRSIPDVLGKSQPEAEAILGDAGFGVAIRPVCADARRDGVAKSVCANTPSGTVVAQGGTAVEGATITLKVTAR